MLKFIRNLFTSNVPSATKPTKTYPYRFTFPDDPQPVTIRERNQREARQFVRDSLDLTRLPIGTTVERLDS